MVFSIRGHAVDVAAAAAVEVRRIRGGLTCTRVEKSSWTLLRCRLKFSHSMGESHRPDQLVLADVRGRPVVRASVVVLVLLAVVLLAHHDALPLNRFRES